MNWSKSLRRINGKLERLWKLCGGVWAAPRFPELPSLLFIITTTTIITTSTTIIALHHDLHHYHHHHHHHHHQPHCSSSPSWSMINIMDRPCPIQNRAGQLKIFSWCKATSRLIEWAGEKGFFLVLCDVCIVSSSVMVKISMIYSYDHFRPQHHIKYLLIFLFLSFFWQHVGGRQEISECLMFVFFSLLCDFYCIYFLLWFGLFSFLTLRGRGGDISKSLMFVFFWPLFAIFLFASFIFMKFLFANFVFAIFCKLLFSRISFLRIQLLWI